MSFPRSSDENPLTARRTTRASKNQAKAENQNNHNALPGTDASVNPESGAGLLADSNKKWRSAWTRGYTSLLMLGVFLLLIYLGHFALLGLIFACQIIMFKEIKRLSTVLSHQQPLPSFRPLHWYWFSTALFFSYGRALDAIFHIQVPYHSMISFSLFASGFVIFVMSLESGYYKYQFETFAWVHLTLLMVVIQSSFMIYNLFQGLIWFILPAALIISNDSWAYVFGFFFGRTPLITLSPKKTVEGFTGAAFATLITGFFLPVFLAQFQALICPKVEFNLAAPQCETPLPFLPHPYELPAFLSSWLGSSHLQLLPVQIHGLMLALFASIIAPFGGFFASGFKRAFRIKDFGESIPGHGGVTDRMDCEILMGLFTYVYLSSFVRTEVDVAGILASFKLMELKDQTIVFEAIRNILSDKGALTA